MHELSIANGIIEMAVEEAEHRRVRVNAIYLKLGPLSGVVKEALLGAWELAAAGTPLENSRLIIEDVPVSAFCQVCREERTLPSMQWLCCPVCGAPTPDIRQGADLEVTALEVES
jgi:hydrogenase nickel incorporation protein HypA/HybF